MFAFCMTKCRVFCCSLVGAGLVFGGCQSAAPTKGPVYKLRRAEFAEPTAPVAVSILDQRPDAERKFKQGAVELMDYQNAIDTLTVDNFEPNPFELLKKSLAAQLSQLSVPPTWAEVDLKSFVVTLNRASVLEAEFERQSRMSDGERITEQDKANRRYQKAMAEYRKACKDAKKNGTTPPPAPQPPPPYLPPSAAPGMGVGVGMSVANGGGGVGGIVGGIGAGLLAATIVSDLEDQNRQAKRLGHVDSAGVTCRIVMHARLHWQDGRREVFDIHVDSVAPPPRGFDPAEENGISLLKFSVNPTVQKAIEQAGIQLRDRGNAYLRQSSTQSPQSPAAGLPNQKPDFQLERLPETPEVPDELESPGSLPTPGNLKRSKQPAGAAHL